MASRRMRGKVPEPSAGDVKIDVCHPPAARAPLEVRPSSLGQITDPQVLFDASLDAHLRGSLTEAQFGYERYLAQLGSLHVVRTNLAGIYLNQGRLEEADHLLSLALSAYPDYSEALSNRGYLALLRGNRDQAVADLEQALHFAPSLAPALTNLLPLYQWQGRERDSLVLLDRALAASPAALSLHELKAQVLQDMEGYAAALSYLELQRSRIEGADLAALDSLRGRLLLAQGIDLPAALKSLDQAIAGCATPQLHDQIHKGEVLRQLHRHAEALAWVDACLGSEGDRGGLLNLKACVLQDLHRFDDALILYQSAIAAEPQNPLFHANLGFLLCARGSHHQAIEVFRRGLELSPCFYQLHHGMAQASFHLGKPSQAYRYYLQAIDAAPDHLNIWDHFLYFLSFSSVIPSPKLIEHCRAYAQQALLPRLNIGLPPFGHRWSPPDARPLRIGILSGEIGSHCVSYFLLSLVLGASREHAEFYLFPTKDRSAEPRWQLFRAHARHFECIEHLSDEDACRRIRALNLDVVLETTQHMVANRLTLMAQRLAPVQAHYIGMHGTTGVPAIDYFIGDDLITPSDFAARFTEKLLRLPRTWVCYTLPEHGLPCLRATKAPNHLRLGSFNNVSKISRACMRVWAKVLLALPKATLLIKDSLRSGELDHQRTLIDYLERLGVNPARISVVPRTESWEDHMDLYNHLDIALDTLPLTSGTTAFDALLMGVPLVAYSTPWIGGRLSASIVHGLGQPNWIADSPEMYVGILKTLAANLTTLRAGRQQRREQFLASQLCDQPGLAAAVVDALRQAYCDAQPV